MHDGVTIKVTLDWQAVKVTLGGIVAPELRQPLGVQSRDHLHKLIAEAKPSLLASAGNQVTLDISQ